MVAGLSRLLPRLGTAWHRLQMAQLGMVWHGVAQHDLAQPRMAQFGSAQHGTAWHSPAQRGTARHGSAHLGTPQHGMTQLGMARHVLATALSTVSSMELPAAPCTPALLLLPLGGRSWRTLTHTNLPWG